jgi:hypothetical protein
MIFHTTSKNVADAIIEAVSKKEKFNFFGIDVQIVWVNVENSNGTYTLNIEMVEIKTVVYY